jgi:uncharacterized protein (DUF427 family)
MSILLHRALREQLGDLRYETTEKLVRAVVAGVTAAESTSALLVWEPRRVVPSYAVPVQDLRAELVPVETRRAGDMPPFLHPGIPFAEHSAAGESFTVRLGGRDLPSAAFRPEDPDLHDHVVLDFGAFDAWYEEEVRLVGHPRDPYHRVDARPSSRHVRVTLDGALLAQTDRPTLVFETHLPVRYYLPREDVKVELRPSELHTVCAYKGVASYWSVGEHEDLVWGYESPLEEARELAGLVAFYDDQVQITVEGRGGSEADADLSATLADERSAGGPA